MARLETSQLPCRFGDYVLLKMLGQGGMGAVWLARQEGYAGIGKICVVKTIRDNLIEDSDYVGRFVDEARTVVALNHRNVCQVFDIGKVESQLYLAMEHIPGRDLRGLIERAPQLPEAVALHIVGEVLEALDYAHRRTDPRTEEPLHLVHRDVSPQNIMVTFEGETKLIDFGLALSRMKSQQTEPGIILGKLAYMSSEQARGDEVDHRTDQFAAAVVCYEMLAGERFYDGLTVSEIWSVAGTGDFRPKRLGAIRPQLAQVLDRALGPHHARYASCAEFHGALSQAQMALRLHATLGDVRAVMERIFPGGALGDRQMAAKLSALPVVDDSHTETMHIAVVADVLAHLAKNETNPTTVLPATLQIPAHDPTQDTSALVAAPRRVDGASRFSPVLAGILGVAAGLTVAAVAVILAMTAQSPAPSASPLVASPSPLAVHAPPPPPAARADAGTANVAHVDDASPHVESAADHVDDVGSAKRPKRAPLPPLPADEPRTLLARLTFLRDHCVARTACARRFVPLANDFTDKVAAMSADDLRATNQDAVACVASCRAQ